MDNIGDQGGNDFLASEKVQSFLRLFSSLFSGENDLNVDHPMLPLVKDNFETYKIIMQYPAFRRDHSALIDFFNKGLKVFSDQSDLYLSIADMLEAIGNYETAISYINQALTLSPTLAVVLRRAKAEIAAGLMSAAEATLQSLRDIDASGETSTLLAQIKLLQGDRFEALKLLNLNMPPLNSDSRVIQSRIFFENGLFSRAREALEGGEPDAGIDRLRKIEQLFLAPLSKELYAYARKPDADQDLIAYVQRRFVEGAATAMVPDELEAKSAALSATGDIDGALLCDRLLLTRHTALGDVEPIRSRIAGKLDALGKIRCLPKVPIRTAKTRILVVMATANPFDPNAQGNKITGSLRYCDFVEPTFVYLKDEIEKSSLAAANRKLIDYCRILQPELIVTPVHFDLLTETMSELKNMGIPIVLDCHDVWTDRMHYVEKNLGNIRFGVTNGLYDFYQSMVSDPEKIFSSPGISFHPNLLIPVERDIPVSFIGTANPIYSPVRRQALDFLQSKGVDVLHLGGYAGGKLLTDEEYCTYIARSRIVLNFSESPLGVNSFSYSFLKGRSIEALTTGSLLLESYNNDTARWFTPGQHYDTFANHDELESKLRMYLSDEPLRQSVATAGHEFFMENYHPFRIWSAVIDAALSAD
jgi:tetratricopeptide (TPR) repeat protein